MGFKPTIKLATCSKNKTMERGRGLQWSTLKLGMVLGTQIEGVHIPGELCYFHPLAKFIFTHKLETCLLNRFNLFRVYFVSVSVALPYTVGVLVELGGQGGLAKRVRVELGPAHPQPHGAAHYFFADLRHEDDSGVFSFFGKLCTVGIRPAEHSPGILNDHDLHAQAHTQQRPLLLSTPLSTGNLPLGAPGSKAAWDNHAISRFEYVPGLVKLLRVGLLCLLVEI
mmetsp:Transcript_4220/g.6296  ORF Transcript_4220/g.6296 Transcript_4220/m.6296 type:complete len:225 (+) Transcript_4220:170-844(+)